MTNQPLHDAETEQLHFRQAALKQRLESAFPPAFPSDLDPEKTIQWIAGNIDKGLCRIYAVHLNECLDEEGYKRLVERVSRRIDDPQLIEQLKQTLAAPAQPELVPLLNGIAFAEIDHILQQAKALGREENFLHVQCTRAGNELIVLADRDLRYEWILPAVQKRLREELSNLHYEPAAIETQSLDLSCGHRLRFFDFELRLVKDRHGEARTRYRLVEKAKRRCAKKARSHPLGRYHPLRFLQPCLNWIARKRSWQIVERAYRQTNAIQVGWRHVPIVWRWSVGLVRWSRRHKLDVTLGAFAVAALICLALLLQDIYANRPREVHPPSLPPGFYLGEYHGDSWWNGEPALAVHYGLYMPPPFQGQKGPFPLLVFLHDYGERTRNEIFKRGLAPAITGIFFKGPDDYFPFVAFFPIDPTGRWQVGSTEVENVMTALDYVIERHQIDPARIYLTGLSNGGNGVWQLAQTYPDKWAAVAPVGSFISPDVQKVRHIPAWIVHVAGASVERQRILVQQLKEANAEVRYTEVPNKGLDVWGEAYNSRELYKWLATKKKD